MTDEEKVVFQDQARGAHEAAQQLRATLLQEAPSGAGRGAGPAVQPAESELTEPLELFWSGLKLFGKKLLGKGTFAHVYEVADSANNRLACKLRA